MSRPICTLCGRPYGRRKTVTETVRWKCKTRTEETGWRDKTTGDWHPGKPAIVLDGEPPPPPPYRGNLRVVKSSDPYLAADTHHMVMRRELWDGQSWAGGYDPFCTLTCALHFARAAYLNGKRYKLDRGTP